MGKESAPRYDALVVLGAVMDWSRKRQRWEFPTVIDRYPGKLVMGNVRARAAHDIHADAGVLLVTGGSDTHPETGEKVSRSVQLTRMITERFEVPREKVIPMGLAESSHTLGNRDNVVAYLSEHPEILKQKRVAVLSPAFQLERARMMFESNPYFKENGIEVEWIVAEDVLEKRSPRYMKWREKVYSSLDAKICARLEADGIKQLEEGAYNDKNAPKPSWIEEIHAENGYAYVVRNTFGQAKKQQGEIVNPRRIEGLNSPDGGGLGVIPETLAAGDKRIIRTHADFARRLVVRSGRVRVRTFDAEAHETIQEIGEGGAYLAGRGVRSSVEALEPSELITGYTPSYCDFGLDDPGSYGTHQVIPDVWDYIRNGPGKERAQYVAGHFYPEGEGTHSVHNELKAQESTSDNPKSMGRKEASQTRYGTSIVLVEKGMYEISLEIEKGKWKTYVIHPGDCIVWDNNIPHKAHALVEGTLQYFFRSPSKQPVQEAWVF